MPASSARALIQLRAVANLDPQNASVQEQIGDAEKSLNHPEAAREAYAAALKLQIEKGGRKRLRAKMAF